MSKVHVFTSAAFNYIPKVRLLFESIKKFHPDWVLHIALPDELRDDSDLSNELFDYIHPIEDLNIPNYRGWAFCHQIVELATAIKPFALNYLLGREDCAKAFYFDPDMVLFSELDDLLAALDENNIILTPHLTEPETDITAVMNNEISALKHGIYNLGFIGVQNNEVSRQFAQWWSERLYNFCRDEIPNGLFTDQRWIDHVPVFFDGVKIIKSPRHNVAPWNLTKREIQGDFDSGFYVNNEKLGFYHFTGFDCGDHKVMMELNSQGNDSARQLVKWYLKRTNELSKDPLSNFPWAFGCYDNGDFIPPLHRVSYRERGDLQSSFPDPFIASGFQAWWNANASIEFPELAKSNSDEKLLKKFKSNLTAGFGKGTTKIDLPKIKQYWHALKIPEQRQKILKKVLKP